MDPSDSAVSTVPDTVCVIWGCELTGTDKTATFEVEEDLFEHQFFIHTICLGAEASYEMHVVEVEDSILSCSHPVPIATLCPIYLPMVSFSGFELVPPILFRLRSGHGPVFIMGQHLILDNDFAE